jgi:hypothetical protein
MSQTPKGIHPAQGAIPPGSIPVPDHWSAEQAMVVWEFLDELARCVWDRYETPLVDLILAEMHQNNHHDDEDQQLDLFDPNDEILF